MLKTDIMRASMVVAGALLFGAPAFAQSPDELAARELLAAQERVARGEYDEAVRSYQRIAEKYPLTETGRVALARAQPNALLGWVDLARTGPSGNRVDVWILGEGYTLEDQNEFDDIAEDLPREFEREPVLREYLGYSSFLRANVRSAEDGIDGSGREVSTALNGEVSTKDAGHTRVDRGLVKELLDQLPEHDGLAIVIVRRGLLSTGSHGVATIGGRDFNRLMYGWGRAFARLRPEYALELYVDREVWTGPNVSDTDDPTRVPWAHWIEAGVPGIGVYEGGDGRVRGAWKPTASGCAMEGGEFFCPVCREALVLRIHDLVDPIESCEPAANGDGEPALETVRDAEPLEFRVRVMRPATHALEVSWWVLPEALVPFAPAVPPAAVSAIEAAERSGRSARGPLAVLEENPVVEASDESGEHVFRLRTKDLEPGRYRVICRARDTTKLRGERFPWVLKDERGVLESEREWRVVVLR